MSASDQESEALVEFRKAVALSPTNPKFLDHLAISLALNGDPDGAIAELQKAIDVDHHRLNISSTSDMFWSRGETFSVPPARWNERWN